MLLKKPANRHLFFVLLVWLSFTGKGHSLSDESEYRAFIRKVSEDIASLRPVYPQLKAFSTDRHADIQDLRVEYRYHTQGPGTAAGWRAGVPAPAPDGIWFYIDLHERDSTSQIHTQPVTGVSYTYGSKTVGFLILEGAETRSVAEEIISILERNGAEPGQQGGDR